MKQKITNTKGSIALIGILIISAMLIILTLGMSESNISSMYQYLNNESSQKMYHVAEGCLEETMFRIEGDITFTGTTLSMGDVSCTSTVSGGTTKNISITINYLSYIQNFSAQVEVTTNGQANNVELLNWEKI